MTERANKREVWRLLDTGAHSGTFNMAADEALVRLSDTPVLRTYCWQPFTISLGFHQKLSELDLQKCSQAGIDVVRRPTGGRAVFHAQEITYSVVIPRAHPLYRSHTLEIYNRISSAIVSGLRQLQIAPVLQPVRSSGTTTAAYRNRFACFSTSAQYEVQALARKLVGSAQRRFKTGLLQHGSILLGDKHLEIMRFISTNTNSENEISLPEKTTSIGQMLAREVSYREVKQPLQTGFCDEFDVTLQTDHFSETESDLIQELIPKYTIPGGSHEG